MRDSPSSCSLGRGHADNPTGFNTNIEHLDTWADWHTMCPNHVLRLHVLRRSSKWSQDGCWRHFPWNWVGGRPNSYHKQMLVRITLVLWMSVSMPMPLTVLEIHHFCYRSLPSRNYQRKKLNFSTGGRHDLQVVSKSQAAFVKTEACPQWLARNGCGMTSRLIMSYFNSQQMLPLNKLTGVYHKLSDYHASSEQPS